MAGIQTGGGNSASVTADGCMIVGNTFGFYRYGSYGIICTRGNNTLRDNFQTVRAMRR